VIALDTNVLVRLFVRDDEGQTARAAELVVGAEERGERCLVVDVVICELVSVLRSYGFDKARIEPVLRGLVEAPVFELEDVERVTAAIDRYIKHKGDFADFLIGQHAADRGCTVYTFDRALLKRKGYATP